MRWIKHLTRARLDDKMTELIADCGLEGYGFWWLLCEVVAESISEGSAPQLTHPLPMWSHLLYSHHHRVGKYMGKLQVIGLCEVSKQAGKVTVKIPNLLKYRDEYTSRIGTKSRVSPDKLPSKSIDTDTDTDIHKKSGKKAPEQAPRAQGETFDGQEPIEWFEAQFTGEWHADTWRTFGVAVNTPELLEAFRANVPLWMRTRKWKSGFGTNSIKFLQSGVWKKPPNKSLMDPEEGCGVNGSNQPPAHALL